MSEAFSAASAKACGSIIEPPNPFASGAIEHSSAKLCNQPRSKRQLFPSSDDSASIDQFCERHLRRVRFSPPHAPRLRLRALFKNGRWKVAHDVVQAIDLTISANSNSTRKDFCTASEGLAYCDGVCYVLCLPAASVACCGQASSAFHNGNAPRMRQRISAKVLQAEKLFWARWQPLDDVSPPPSPSSSGSW